MAHLVYRDPDALLGGEATSAEPLQEAARDSDRSTAHADRVRLVVLLDIPIEAAWF